jgi:hypothetical protein
VPGIKIPSDASICARSSMHVAAVTGSPPARTSYAAWLAAAAAIYAWRHLG